MIFNSLYEIAIKSQHIFVECFANMTLWFVVLTSVSMLCVCLMKYISVHRKRHGHLIFYVWPSLSLPAQPLSYQARIYILNTGKTCGNTCVWNQFIVNGLGPIEKKELVCLSRTAYEWCGRRIMWCLELKIEKNKDAFAALSLINWPLVWQTVLCTICVIMGMLCVLNTEYSIVGPMCNEILRDWSVGDNLGTGKYVDSSSIYQVNFGGWKPLGGGRLMKN